VPVTQVQARVEVSTSSGSGVWITAPDIHLHAELRSLRDEQPIAAAVRRTLEAVAQAGESVQPTSRRLDITVTSSIPRASGLGSGTAVSVAVIRAIAAHLARPLGDEEVSKIAYEIDKLHHGTPSGIDNAVITSELPVFFVRGRPPEAFVVGKPLTIVIGDTGKPAPTREAVEDVRRLWKKDKEKWENVFARIGEIAKRARKAMETGEQVQLGQLMDENHGLLREMTVSSKELERLVAGSKRAGALGAKLSGGGRGGNMIALTEEAHAGAVASALQAAGAKQCIIARIE
jgi:mevalonate kinase